MADEGRLYLSDPTSLIEDECANPVMKQKDVALTYAIAIRDEAVVPVDWPRANRAILKRWPKGLQRVKEMAWKRIKDQEREAAARVYESVFSSPGPGEEGGK